MQAGPENSKRHSILLAAAGAVLMTVGLPRTALAQAEAPLPPPPPSLAAPALAPTPDWTARDVA